MDGFSDLVRLFHLRANVYHNAKICGNWLYSQGESSKTCFHVVTEGSCVLDVPGHLSTVLDVGDVVIFPREVPHTMYPATEVKGDQEVVAFHEAEGLDGTGMLCAQANFDHLGSHYLVDALPTVFVVRHDADQPWACHLKTLIMLESVNPSMASDTIINRLSEMLFIYAIRTYMQAENAPVGLLALYADSRLKQAIAALHQDIKFAWTVESLAKQANMSRTAFAEKFKAVSGWTPAQYLAWWRMQMAWQWLSEGRSVADVADSVGYQSEAAFSRAFQRQFQRTVGQVRRGVSV
ncbi:MAG: AraC family transcriptional regulator [Pontibacterium sp.]